MAMVKSSADCNSSPIPNRDGVLPDVSSVCGFDDGFKKASPGGSKLIIRLLFRLTGLMRTAKALSHSAPVERPIIHQYHAQADHDQGQNKVGADGFAQDDYSAEDYTKYGRKK